MSAWIHLWWASCITSASEVPIVVITVPKKEFKKLNALRMDLPGIRGKKLLSSLWNVFRSLWGLKET